VPASPSAAGLSGAERDALLVGLSEGEGPAPGADDDGTGVAGVLGAARAIAAALVYGIELGLVPAGVDRVGDPGDGALCTLARTLGGHG
jgi:Zn-dependent M28 family amino/carboxypeptidase